MPTHTTTGPKYVIGMKFDETEKIERERAGPGPASYKIKDGIFADSSMAKEPSFGIGTAAQRGGQRSLKEERHTPGPANYNSMEAGLGT